MNVLPLPHTTNGKEVAMGLSTHQQVPPEEGAEDGTQSPVGSVLPPTVQEIANAGSLAPTVNQFAPGVSSVHGKAPSPAGETVRAPTVRVIAGYEILEELGRGAMGVVYKARQIALKRLVALKMILAGDHAAPSERDRFRLEAEAVARLQHPNIVQIYEIGEQDGKPFFSLEFVDGGNLRDKLASAPMPARDAARLIETLARTMHFAHRHGIIHRDLKPGNVLLTHDGTPKISDFGLAKQLESDSGQTQPGQVVGTPRYMAPEQAAGNIKAISHASDTYALGAILYEMLTGRPPFQAASMLDTLSQVQTQEPVPPGRLQPTVPRDLETICLKCLAKVPRQRYSSADALADDLRRFREGRPILARPVGRGERLWRWCRRNPTAAALMVSLCVGILAAAGLTVWALDERDRAGTKAQEALNQTIRAIDLANKEAEQRRRAEKALAHSLIASVREKSVTAPPGWTWEALADLERAKELQAGETDLVELRSLMADCLGRADLRQVGVLAEGLDAAALAFRKDGQLLAIAQRKDAVACSVQVYDLATRKRVATYSFPTVATSMDQLLKGNARYQEGIFSLAFSPDGKWLVAGTRLGKLCRWDTTVVRPKAVVWQADHDKGVTCLAFSPDGRYLISGGENNTMRWDLANEWQGSALPLRGTSGAAFSADGTLLAVTGEDALKLLVGKDQQPRKTIPERIDGYTLDLSPDGRTLAMQTNNEIHLVDVAHAELRRSLRASEQGSVDPLRNSLHFSPDGALLVASWSDHRVRLWDVASGKKFAELFIADRYDPFSALSPDGRFLAVIADHRTLLYELRQAEFQTMLAQQSTPVKAIDFSANGDTLISSSERTLGDRVVESQLIFWDVKSGRLQRNSKVFTRPGDDVRYTSLAGALAVHPRREMVASVSSMLGGYVVPSRTLDLGLTVLESPNREGIVEVPAQALQLVGTGHEMCADCRAHEGRALRIPGTRPGAGIRFRIPASCFKSKAEGWAVMAAVRVERKGETGPAFLSSLVAPPNMAWPCTMNLDPIPEGEYHLHTCQFVNVKECSKFEWMDVTLGVAEKSCAVEALWVDRVFLIPITARDWLREMVVPRLELLRFTPDGSRLWGVHDEEVVVSWQVPEFKVATRWTDAIGKKLYGFKRLNALAAGNHWVAVGSEAGDVHLLSAAEGRPEHHWRGPGGGIRALALDPSETLAVLGTEKGKLRLIRVPDGAVVADLPRHEQSVEAIVFSRDGRLLVTGSLDQTVRLWQKTETGFQLVLSLKAPSGRITSLRLSPDQTELAILNEPDRGVHLWHLDRLKARLDGLGVGWLIYGVGTTVSLQLLSQPVRSSVSSYL